MLSASREGSEAAPVAVFEFDDPTAVGERFEVADLDTLQLDSQPLRVRRVLVRLERCLLVYHSTNRKVRTRTILPSGVMAVVGLGPRADGTMNALPIGSDCVVIAAPEAELEFVVQAGYESIAFMVSLEEMQGELRHRKRDFRATVGGEVLKTGRSISELYRFGSRVVHVAASRPSVFDLAQTRASAGREAIEMLVRTLTSTSRPAPQPGDRTRQAHRHAVRLAEEYALANAAADIHMSDLCKAAGVSERTLQYAFKELMGMNPVAYLHRLRLHRVRQSLRAATAGSTTVTREALRWGFWHFGEFSRSYKACFGERPSETLRRAPEDAEQCALARAARLTQD